MLEKLKSAESAHVRKGPDSRTSQLKETLKDKQDVIVDVDGKIGKLSNQISFFVDIKRDGAMIYIEKFGTNDYYLILSNHLFHKLYDGEYSDVDGKELYKNNFVLIDGSTGEVTSFDISENENILRVGDKLFISDKQQINIAAPIIITYRNGNTKSTNETIINTGIGEKISMTGFNPKSPLWVLYGNVI